MVDAETVPMMITDRPTKADICFDLNAANAYAASPALLGCMEDNRANEYAVIAAIHAATIKDSGA